ncbi:MAG: MFS transporter, partial [Rhizobacter sp.]|nr:MFS transporter [Chlorobiales bacterium]
AIFGRRSNLSAFLSTALVAVASYTIVPFLNPYFVANVGFTEQQLPLLYVAGGVLTFLISWPVGRLSDKFGKVKVYAVMSALLMPSTLAVTTIGLTPFAIATGIFVSYMVLSAGRRVPAAAVIASSVSPKERAGFLSFNTSVQQLSSGLSAAGAGLLLTQIKGEPMQGFGTVGIIATVAAVLAAVLLSQVKSSAMPVSAEQNSLPLAGLVAPKTVSANSPESK